MQGQATERATQLLDRRGPPPSAAVVGKLEATRAGMATFVRGRCLLSTLLVVLALAGLLAAADWMWTLPGSVRAAGLLGIGVVAAFLLGRGLAFSARRFRRRDAAAEVEAAFPILGQRVRTTLEYTEPDADTAPAAPSLVMALATDTDRRTSGLDFRGLIPWRSLCWPVAGLLGIAGLFLVLLAVSPESRTAALRVFLVPVAYTQLEVRPGDVTLKVGNDLSVQATVSGRPVSAVELHSRPAGSDAEWTTVSLAPPDEKPAGSRRLRGTLETTLQDCRDDLEYRVSAGPVESPVYRLTILRPLQLKEIEAQIEPPAYTRRPAVTVKEGNFKVITGSRVRFHLTLDRQPQTARLLLFPTAAGAQPEHAPPVDLQIRGKDLTAELPSVEQELEYEIDAVAADGMRLEASRFRIQVQPDRKPTVRFIKPQEQIEVTPTTEVNMKLEAGDDFGLSAVGIVYQVGNGPKQTLLLQRDPAQPGSLKAEAVLPLEDHEVGFQDAITYYAFAEDNHPDKPQRTTTELQFIDIRPFKRAYQLLDTGGT
jgi:hypothetical protein